ncbi:MAG: GGDEF domain-containing protein [Planctomycetaceae bacterium]|nr:GGDEF domain-containing protein [Planctomycetaceae bacterium]
MLDPKRIWLSSQLPTLPSVAAKLLELVRDPETSIDDVVGIIRSDPAISAKLVKAANGSYFGVRTAIKTIDRAVPLLGTTVSTSLALSFVLADDSMKAGPLSEHYRRYWKQSIVQSSAAECLGKRLPNRDASEFFLAGLLLDLGRLAMLKTIPKEYLPVLDRSEAEQRPLGEIEIEVLGFSHALVGAKLLENWKLPTSFVRTAELQAAAPEELWKHKAEDDYALLVGGALAAAVGDYFCTSAKGHSLERMRRLFPSIPNAGADLDGFLRQCEQTIQQTANLFDVDVTDLGNSTDLMVQANEQLLQLTLREHASCAQAQMNHEALTAAKTKLEEQNRVLLAQAVHDPLTGLYNRKFFDDSLAREANRCQRQAAPIATIFVDVDHFKSLNDGYGHAVGDGVLREIAKRFRASVRASDVLARYGGEEFVILVHQPTEKGVESLANRVRDRVAGEPFLIEGHTLSVTCSLGAAIAIPGRKDRNVGDRLLSAADQAMYSAKGSGRNRTVMSSLVSEEDRELHQRVTNHRFSRWLVQRRLLEVPAVSRALLECPVPTARIGELAEQFGYMSPEQVLQILQEQEGSEERFGVLSIRKNFLSPSQLVHLLTLQHENPKQLTAAIVRLGLLAPDVAAKSLEEYSLEQTTLVGRQPVLSL